MSLTFENVQVSVGELYLVLWTLVSGVVSRSPQIQGLAARRSAAFPCGGGCCFCGLCDLDALGCDGFLLIFKL